VDRSFTLWQRCGEQTEICYIARELIHNLARRRPVALTWSRNIEWDVDDWRDNASCRDTDPDLFFPIGTTGPAIEQIESAKRVCYACEAQEACLEFALATNQESGIWGGTSEEERRKLRKSWLARQRRAS
jgi:WhiB family redox-sensing transcriptional regulator